MRVLCGPGIAILAGTVFPVRDAQTPRAHHHPRAGRAPRRRTHGVKGGDG